VVGCCDRFKGKSLHLDMRARVPMHITQVFEAVDVSSSQNTPPKFLCGEGLSVRVGARRAWAGFSVSIRMSSSKVGKASRDVARGRTQRKLRESCTRQVSFPPMSGHFAKIGRGKETWHEPSASDVHNVGVCCLRVLYTCVLYMSVLWLPMSSVKSI
jgi:hypothetical protein